MNKQRVEEILQNMAADKKIRHAVIKRSFLWFFIYYFSHLMVYSLADFQREIIFTAENSRIRNVAVAAFRNSAKSTIITLAFAIWSILGRHQRKYILIVSKTQDQAQEHLLRIRRALESNERLTRDLGPFQEERIGQWNLSSLYIPKFRAKIKAISLEEGIRGTVSDNDRPQVVIFDDVEDLDSVRTQESRDTANRRIFGDIIPAAATGARLFFVGNIMHPDGIFNRVSASIDAGASGKILHVPIHDEHDNPAWPEKFPTKAAIDEERKNQLMTDWNLWAIEYLLVYPIDEMQIIKPSYIMRGNPPPLTKEAGYRYTAIGVDLAYELHEKADYTAMVIFDIFIRDNQKRAYLRKEYVNERLNPQKSIEKIVELVHTIGEESEVRVFAEKANAESIIGSFLSDYGIKFEMLTGNLDKDQRKRKIVARIQFGNVLFPPPGEAELPIRQLTGSGVEKHDDLADAITVAVIKIFEEGEEKEPGGAYGFYKKEYEEMMKRGPSKPSGLADWVRWAEQQKRRNDQWPF